MGWIEELATLCGDLSVIATLCAAIYRFSRRLERMERHQHNDYLCMLRLMILSEELPVEERLKAGEEYVREGGNGAIKARYQLMLEEYQEEIGGNDHEN